MMLKGVLLERADQTRGRFRSLVLRRCKDFLPMPRTKRRARKRGGDVQIVSWDDVGWLRRHRISRSRLYESERWSPERISMCAGLPLVVERALSPPGRGVREARAATRFRCAE